MTIVLSVSKGLSAMSIDELAQSVLAGCFQTGCGDWSGTAECEARKAMTALKSAGLIIVRDPEG